MKDASAESARFEPTVFGAMRRYRIMVLVFALAGMVAAVGYTLHQGRLTRPRPVSRCLCPQSQQNQDAAQYLDSQVLLMESPAVAAASGQHRRRHIAEQQLVCRATSTPAAAR